MNHIIKAFIRKGEEYYVAECLEISVVTQGKTLDETIANLKEAVTLHLEGEDLSEYGLAPNPTLLVTIELEPIVHVAQTKEIVGKKGHFNSRSLRLYYSVAKRKSCEASAHWYCRRKADINHTLA